MASSVDLFGAWREALQRWEQDANAAITAASSDARVSQAMNQSLSAAARLQAAQAEATEQFLARANLPSRADFRQLGERLDSIEGQLAELTTLVRRMAPTAGAKAVPVAAPKLKRTRQPPSPEGGSKGKGR